ncbi:hypothetical protein ACFL3V_06225 [Nanoarchaeota archaeon]
MIYTTIMEWAHVIILVIASILSLIALRNIHRAEHSRHIMVVKKTVFTLLAPATIALTSAFLIKNLSGCLCEWTTSTLFNTFSVIGYLLLAAAFIHFWHGSGKHHTLHLRDKIFMFGVCCGVFIWLYYLYRIVIIPGSAGTSFLQGTLNIFLPLIVSIIFILTLVVHPRLKAGIIRTPIWYISNGIFVHFLGFMFAEYHKWSPYLIKLPGVAATLFTLGALYFALGFYAADRKYSITKKAAKTIATKTPSRTRITKKRVTRAATRKKKTGTRPKKKAEKKRPAKKTTKAKKK